MLAPIPPNSRSLAFNQDHYVQITFNTLDQQEERFSAKRSSQAVLPQRVHHHYLDWAPLVGRLQCPNQTCDSSNFQAFADFGSHGEKMTLTPVLEVWEMMVRQIIIASIAMVINFKQL